MPRYVVELTRTAPMTGFFSSREEAVRFVQHYLEDENFTSITITKQCESEESSASDATRICGTG